MIYEPIEQRCSNEIQEPNQNTRTFGSLAMVGMQIPWAVLLLLQWINETGQNPYQAVKHICKQYRDKNATSRIVNKMFLGY